MEKSSLMGQHRSFFPDNKFRSTGKEHYEWKIYKNPVGAGDIYLEMRDGEVVGSSTVTRKKVAILDERLMAAELGDSFTRPEYRGQGINTKALKYCIEYALSHGMDIIYGAPATPGNYRLLKKLGLLPCSHINYDFLNKSFNPVLFTIKLVAKILLFRNISKNLRYLRYLVKRKLKQFKQVQPYKKYHENDFDVVIIDKFNEKVDPLWGKPRYLFYVIRDSSYLNWRYFRNIDRFIVLAATKDEEYLGYIALKMSKDSRSGVICDFITINDRSDVFLALVRKSEEILKRNGATLVQVECIVDTPYYHVLNRFGYYGHGRESHQHIIIYSKTEQGKRILKKRGRWHFTLGDTNEV